MGTLKEIRQRLFISRRELAELAGVSASSIVRAEQLDGHTTRDVAEKILKALSEELEEELTIEGIGLHIYDIMRDRRQNGGRNGRE